MLKFDLKKFIFSLVCILPIFTVGVFASSHNFFSYDDRDPVFTYSSSTKIIDISAYDSTYSSVPATGSIAFDFIGQQLSIYGCRYHNSTYPHVFIDGVEVSGSSSYNPTVDYTPCTWFFMNSDLAAVYNIDTGKHHVVVVPDQEFVIDPTTSRSTAPRFYFDYISVTKDLDTAPLKFFSFYIPFLAIVLLSAIYILFKSVFWRLNYDD